MLRGSLESVASGRVSGWIFSASGTLRDSLMLAFLDTVCIGAGRVEIFRQDLADAGLGDGYLGFSFPITLEKPGDAQRIVVRLDGSDTLLMHRDSRVVDVAVMDGAGSSGKSADSPTAAGYPLATLQWMRGRGWLAQAEYDFLRYFRQFGVYDRSLANKSDQAVRSEIKLSDPAVVAHEMLPLLFMAEAEVSQRTVMSTEEMRELSFIGVSVDTTVAIWSPRRARLDVIEGSHQRSGEEATLPAAVEYPIGPDRLLFLDTRASFGNATVLPMDGVQVFFISGL